MATTLTITDQESRVDYDVDAADDTFEIPFEFFELTDIRVSVGGSELNSGFTVSGDSGTTTGFPGGTLTLDSAVSNTTVSIWRDIPVSRTSVFPESGEFSIRSLNTQLARIVAMLQQENQTFLRAFRLPESEAGKLAELPDAASRAGKVAAFDNNGDSSVSNRSLPELENQAVEAENWATTTGATVKDATGADTGKYSAKEHAQGDETATGGSAKAWAVDSASPDGTSAKSAKTHAGNAASSASAAANSSANASASESKAEEWAEKPENSEVEPGKYSAKHYAAKAAKFDPNIYLETDQLVSNGGVIAETTQSGGETTATLAGREVVVDAADVPFIVEV